MKGKYTKIGLFKKGMIGVLLGFFLVGTWITPASGKAPAIAVALEEKNIKSLDEYLVWMENNLQYQNEPRDAWAAAQATFTSGGGDCEDLAILHQAVLEHFGYKSKILAIGKGNRAHVFTLFNKDGALYMLNNTTVHVYQTYSADRLVKSLMAQFDASFLLQIDGISKSVKILYSKESLPLKFQIKNLRVS